MFLLAYQDTFIVMACNPLLILSICSHLLWRRSCYMLTFLRFFYISFLIFYIFSLPNNSIYNLCFSISVYTFITFICSIRLVLCLWILYIKISLFVVGKRINVYYRSFLVVFDVCLYRFIFKEFLSKALQEILSIIFSF